MLRTARCGPAAFLNRDTVNSQAAMGPFPYPAYFYPRAMCF